MTAVFAAKINKPNNFTVPQVIDVTDAATVTTSPLLTLDHRSSGLTSAIFGVGLDFHLQTTTTPDRPAARVAAVWEDAVEGAQTACLAISTVHLAGALTEVARFTGDRQTILRATAVNQAAGLHVPWVSGDAFRTCRIGASTAGNNQIALSTASDSSYGLFASTNSGIGVAANSGTGTPLVVSQTAQASLSSVGVLALYTNNPASGTPLAGFGASWRFQISSATVASRNAGHVDAQWVDPTDATRKARLTVQAYDTVAREGFRVEGSGSAPLISFFGASAQVKQTSGADLTNSVTSGGTSDIIADFSDLTTYSNSAATIRNDIYQLARKLKQINDGLRAYGLFT